MARPSKEAERELERLESLAALAAGILMSVGVASIRARQVMRRIRGNAELRRIVGPLGEELAQIADDADDMHEILAEILEVKQRERTAQDAGRD